MPRPRGKAPALRYQISGQSIVTIDGHDYVLGKHDSPEAFARYAVLIQIYQEGGLKVPSSFRVEELERRAESLLGHTVEPTQQAEEPIFVRQITASYRELIQVNYASNLYERHRLKPICDETDQYEVSLRASGYGPLALKRQRQLKQFVST